MRFARDKLLLALLALLALAPTHARASAASARAPRPQALATYRLQLHSSFGFEQAASLLPYLRRLGVHPYLSPVLTARTGSTHGYDVVDPKRVSPALGGERGLRRLFRRAAGLGQEIVVDIVPNHMGVGPENRYWDDVLQNGRASRFAHFFDIDWGKAGRKRLVLPVLGRPLGEALESGDLKLRRGEDGRFRVHYFETSFPLSPRTVSHLTGDSVTIDQLRTILNRQAYRLAHWKQGASQVNYRRFFSINDLAAVRQEDPRVFAATQSETWKVARMARDLGTRMHLRIDHPDGLAKPGTTLREISRRLSEVDAESKIWVEAILAKGQSLPSDWPVAGTTGYDFLAQLERTQVEPSGFRQIDRWYRRSILGEPNSTFDAAVVRGKREMLRGELSPDLKAVGGRKVESDIVALSVYRTYAAERATLERFPLVARREQLSAAAMAKGLEDTAHYRDYACAALNEVGTRPDELTRAAVAEFHAENAARNPSAMRTVSTHDTKRSADARARLAVLTEVPETWIAAVDSWRKQNRTLRGRIDANSEYLVYQTLLALWPRANEMTATRLVALRERVEATMLKAVREAKQKTTWAAPNRRFEAELVTFIRSLFENPFLRDFQSFVERIEKPAVWASLARTLIHYTAPGVPDTYQGDELWNLSAVDPDNRRPVDFARRERLLSDVERFDGLGEKQKRVFVRALADAPKEDRIKLHVVRAALRARNTHPQLFADANYLPLHGAGVRQRNILAFARVSGGDAAIVITPRFSAKLAGDPMEPGAWGGTRLTIPASLVGKRVVNVLTGQHRVLGSSLALAEVLSDFPVALFVSESG